MTKLSDLRPSQHRLNPNAISETSFSLSANSKFTQERLHRTPVGKSGLKQIQANKRGE